MTIDIDLAACEPVAPEAVRAAYPDCPSVGRLMLEAVAEHHAWHMAALHPDRHAAAYIRELERTFWVLHGAAVDIVALQSEQDLHSAAQAARAGKRIAALDGGWSSTSDAARARLRQAYAEWRSGERHPWDCPGRCGGAGEVLEVVTEEYQGDGIWVPVWQEPVDCDRGLDLEHLPDCACGGTGWVIDRDEAGRPHERGRCPGLPSAPAATGPEPGPAFEGWDAPPF